MIIGCSKYRIFGPALTSEAHPTRRSIGHTNTGVRYVSALPAKTTQPIPHNACAITGKRVIDRRPVEVLPKPDHTTQRLLFRPLAPSDKAAFINALDQSRSQVRRWIPTNREAESDNNFFDRTLKKARLQHIEGTAWRRAAFVDHGPDAGRFLGIFNLIKIQRGLEWTCEANWWVDSRLAGNGYASEAVQGILDFALTEHPVGLSMHRVRCYICKDNPASVRIAQKCGFTPTGNREVLEINKALVRHDEFECWAR